MGVWRDLGQRLRAVDRDRDDARDRAKLLIGRSARPRGWRERQGIESATPGMRPS